jgi:hypothetical protein
VICLSTDKAVYPINAMGISKAMMEKVMVATSRTFEGTGTVACGTRYGNVMASRGSVIPLFVNQVLAGKPHCFVADWPEASGNMDEEQSFCAASPSDRPRGVQEMHPRRGR